jgi:uncharacterized protein YvpB
MDGWGGLHAFAPSGTPMPPNIADSSHAYWRSWDIARSVTMWTAAPGGSSGGWTMDGYGGFHAFGSAPGPGQFTYWAGWDIAHGSAGAGSGSSFRVNSRVLNVPFIHQAYELSCEEAALQMALAYRGIGVGQGDLLNAIGVDYRLPASDGGGFHWGDPYASFVGDPNGSEVALTGYGTYLSTISGAARRFGAGVTGVSEGFPPSSVYQAILDGHPVVAWVSFDLQYHANTAYYAFDGRIVQFGAPYEHAVTVIGVTPDSVLVNDPWRGQLWISKSTFQGAYATFNNMAVVIA